jgi:hypothetical protein
VTLSDDLVRIAEAARAYGVVTGVLAAEPKGGARAYLVALEGGQAPRWAALDTDARLLDRREAVRDVAAIVAMCEIVSEVAGGGHLDELRRQLVRVRIVENPPGVEDAERSALALEHVLGAPPRLASPAFLDAVGAATLELERTLGQLTSPFTEALRDATGVVDEFVRDVEQSYVVALR